ncbi:glycosyltransferase [Glutamicibacter arilaitensis]|uniref:glycosyltransferase n=1 Tax=Glutamicibacter arilaitensis TaxID=256701 RepID=UPI003FD1F4EC
MATITFLSHNIYGVGGTVRTVVNLANELAKWHEVSILSVYQRVDRPSFEISPKVKVIPLVDTRPGSKDRDDERSQFPSREIPAQEELYDQYSALSDDRLRQFFLESEPDVFISTRPGLAIMMAKYTKPHTLRIAQEHTSAAMLEADLVKEMRSSYGNIQEVVTVTNYERELFERLYEGINVRVSCIANSFTVSDLPRSTQQNKLIVAAGRLNKGKRFELLVHAFAQLRDEFPDWKVRIYGGGAERSSLKLLTQKLKLSNHVHLMGPHGSMAAEWRKGSIAVSTSDAESFGMTIIEAMDAGLAVLSTDCPVGPREIIENGTDGILSEVGNLSELTRNLRRLLSDRTLREKLAENSELKAKQFSSTSIAMQYNQLMADAGLLGAVLETEAPTVAGGKTAPVLEIKSISGNEILLRMTFSRRDFIILPAVTFFSKTKKALDFSARLQKIESADEGSRYEAVISSDQFNTDAIWDTKFSTLGRRIDYTNLSVDSSSLVSSSINETRSGFSHIIPFSSAQGELRVRSWRRKRHAELASVRQRNSLAIVDINSLFAQSEIKDAVLVRRGINNDRISLPVDFQGVDSLRLVIDLAKLAELAIDNHEDWDLFLREKSKRIRVSKIIDDVVLKKHIYSYPAWNFEDYNHLQRIEERVSIRPYLSIRNDLSFSVISRKV